MNDKLLNTGEVIDSERFALVGGKSDTSQKKSCSCWPNPRPQLAARASTGASKTHCTVVFHVVFGRVLLVCICVCVCVTIPLCYVITYDLLTFCLFLTFNCFYHVYNDSPLSYPLVSPNCSPYSPNDPARSLTTKPLFTITTNYYTTLKTVRPYSTLLWAHNRVVTKTLLGQQAKPKTSNVPSNVSPFARPFDNFCCTPRTVRCFRLLQH